MRRLVESWIRAEKALHGNNLAAAIRLLNDQRSMSITHSRVAEWRRGRYVPSQVCLSHMLLRTLPWALEQAGIPASLAQRYALVDLLWMTKKKPGETLIYLL